MSDKNYFELIKLNIKYLFSEIKSQREAKRLFRKDKLVQSIPAQNFGYEDLTPEADIKNGQEYINALFWGIKNKNVKNIALTGPYGSGKSSIIQSYLKMYPSTKGLNISLATFDFNKEDNGGFENEIELGILKQLFYKVDSDKIPQSRYRKIKKRYFRKYFCIITGIILASLLGIAFFSPDTINTLKEVIEKSSGFYGIGIIPSYAISCLFGLFGIGMVTYAFKWCLSKFRIKEINIADKATMADDKDDDSIFNKSMDEIVYFFEATDYKVVFIEDLDRFDSTKIFVKLRELNTILNNYDLIKRRIVFVYAIKDDMFKNEEKTKFFDFIIPVIPIINSTNSGEILREKLKVKKQDDGSYRSSIYDISSGYITLISPFIEDMRVLTNICNEFIVYKKSLQSLNLKDEEMFSMMIFKSLYPIEFSKLEAEKGIVKQAFNDKYSFIKSKQMEIDTKRMELEQILNSIEKDIFKSVRDVKAAFLNYLVGETGPFNYCNLNGNPYYYYQIMSDDFDMNKFNTTARLVINSYRGNGRDISDLKNDERAQGYLIRIRNLKNSEGNRKNEIRNKIDDYNREVAELYSFSLKKLIEMYGSKVIFSEEVQENKFLIFLIRKGYINENYADYINYFHPNSITKEEMNFVRGVRMQESIGDFSYPIRNVEQVCERIEPYEFKQIEILNFDIVDYLITQEMNSDKCKELFFGLSREEDKFDKFIKAYIERKKNIDIFMKLLCKQYHTFWKVIVNDDLLTDDKKFEYLSLILEFADISDIIELNNKAYIMGDDGEEDDEYYEVDCIEDGIKSYIEGNPQALKKLSNVSDNKMIEVIEELEICFTKILVDGANISVLDYIFENDYYELNIDMLYSLFEIKFPDKLQYLQTANYTTICEVNFEPLKERLIDINVFKEYVLNLVIKQNSNINENIGAVENILERLFDIDQVLCKEVLDKEKVVWSNIIDCCKCIDEKKNERKIIWNHVLENEQVLPSWDNFLAYYNEYCLTNELVKWIEKVIVELVKKERPKKISDDVIEEIIINLSTFALDKLTEVYSVENFSVSLLKFDEERVSVLIKNKYIPFSKEYLEELYLIAPKYVPEYIISFKEEYLDNIEDLKVSTDTVVALLRSGCFKNEIIKLIESVSLEDINQEMAIEIQKLEVLVPKEYVEKVWDLVDEGKRYQLLLNQLENYSITEISTKLASLAPVYQKLSDISKKHREHLPLDEYGYNEKLLGKLKEIDYLSSVKKDEYYEEDYITHNKQIKYRFEVWIKKQQIK